MELCIEPKKKQQQKNKTKMFPIIDYSKVARIDFDANIGIVFLFFLVFFVNYIFLGFQTRDKTIFS